MRFFIDAAILAAAEASVDSIGISFLVAGSWLLPVLLLTDCFARAVARRVDTAGSCFVGVLLTTLLLLLLT